jgi:hypothetical protein
MSVHDIDVTCQKMRDPIYHDGSGELWTIKVDGHYWGQKSRVYGTPVGCWFICFSPKCLENETNGEGTVGVYVDDCDFDLTVRQLIRISQCVAVPF